jgi:nitrite reductase/ring-hydroxylating ferredoxin subunit
MKRADCGGCELAAAGRRVFIKEMALAAAGILAIGALDPSELLAVTVGEVTPAATALRRRIYPMPATDAIQVDVENEVILARWQNRVYAFSTKCPHKGARLRWLDDEQKIFCPKHKARFGRDGSHLSGRGTRPLHRHGIARADNSVVVDLDTVWREADDAPAWKAAVITL